jgi:hypothetical protein
MIRFARIGKIGLPEIKLGLIPGACGGDAVINVVARRQIDKHDVGLAD